MTTPAAASLPPPIKPCPFCGNAPKVTRTDRSVWITCESDGCPVQVVANRFAGPDAIKGWNTRACVAHAFTGQARDAERYRFLRRDAGHRGVVSVTHESVDGAYNISQGEMDSLVDHMRALPEAERKQLYEGGDDETAWVSADERLPTVGQWVLTWGPAYTPGFGVDVVETEGSFFAGSFPTESTHWMPLPEGPKS